MSVITRLSVQNIRSHDSFIINLSPDMTVITGQNGSGKTTLIEAIYVALRGSSFKGNDGDILRKDSPWWRIDLTFEDNTKRTVKFDPSLIYGRKQFIVDEKTSYRLTPKNKHPVVLFEPDDLRLLNGSPTRRRQFIDRFIGQLDPLYATTLRKYERALKQRNNLLKKPFTNHDELFVWNIALSEYGSYIIEQRTIFIEQINSKLNDAYNDIAKSNDFISVHYSHTSIGDIKQKLLSELHHHSEKDRLTGSTSVGPHRHDVIFKFNDTPALSIASRGEVRTIVLALKFLEVGIIEQITNIKPIILLDDVFSELDINRQNTLSDTIRSHQIIITSTQLLSDNKTYQHIQLTS
ncbi:DNA replication and repair protein RecF [Candidatus Saccharibacteria bacterium]|nr:DNA replication and repair protein RecF [Candidatus Saccharibacteria bacterium]